MLGRSPSNPWHAQPFRLDARTFDGWLEGCGLPEGKRELLRRMTYAEGDKIAKMVPNTLNISLDEAVKDSAPLKQAIEKQPGVAELIETAKVLEGLTRHASTHAAGVVISREPLTELMPLQKATNSDALMTQYEMHGIEALGLLKFDFLGLSNLTILRKAVDLIAEHRGVTVDEVLGDEAVTGVRLRDVATGATSDLPVEGFFLAIGHRPNTAPFEGWLAKDEKGYLVVAHETHSAIEGVFIAGDVHDHRYRQAITAAGDGCRPLRVHDRPFRRDDGEAVPGLERVDAGANEGERLLALGEIRPDIEGLEDG